MGHWFITLKDKIISGRSYKFVEQLEALSILEACNVLLSPEKEKKNKSCVTFYRLYASLKLRFHCITSINVMFFNDEMWFELFS